MRFSEEVCNAFHQKAAVYQKAAIAQQAIGDALFERLDYIKLNPRAILDVGCGTGYFTQRLKEKYPKANVIGIDIAQGMLAEAEATHGTDITWLHADMHDLPFEEGVFDLVFSNQVLHWSDKCQALMQALHRVMSVEGCLMFSTVGPDTLLELRGEAEAAHAHTNTFMDMHDIGDILLKEQFLDPVVDMERLTLHYDSVPRLLSALKSQGVRNMNPNRNPGLTGKKAWRDFEATITQQKTATGHYPLTYEAVYGHAWKGDMQRMNEHNEASFSIAALRNSLNRRSGYGV